VTRGIGRRTGGAVGAGAVAPVVASAPIKLGLRPQLGMALSGVIGSGWLLAAQSAAQTEGPLAVVSWVLGALVLGLMASVMLRMAAARPQSGALVRWPTDSSGRTAGTVMASGLIMVYAANAPTECVAVVTAMGQERWGRALTTADGLHTYVTAEGRLIAACVMALLFAINWAGLRAVAEINAALTVLKFLFPLFALIILAVAGFSVHNIGSHGGLHPGGYLVGINGIVTAGMVFSYTGFQGPIDHAGEVDGAKLRSAVRSTLLMSAALYIALQIVFLGSAPAAWFSASPHTWSLVHYDAPYVQLAQQIGVGWLAVLLFVDSIISPAATALVFVSFTGASLKATAEKRVVAWSELGRTFGARKVPRYAFAVNFTVGVVMLAIFRSWSQIAGATGMMVLFVYSYAAVSYGAFRRDRRSYAPPSEAPPSATDKPDPYAKPLRIAGPLCFALPTVICYYTGWQIIWKAMLILTALALFMLFISRRVIDKRIEAHFISGLWLIGYFTAFVLLSALGRYSGPFHLVPEPIDGLAAFALGLGAYYAGVAQSAWFLGQRREAE
jgi:amino acid transporter